MSMSPQKRRAMYRKQGTDARRRSSSRSCVAPSLHRNNAAKRGTSTHLGLKSTNFKPMIFDYLFRIYFRIYFQPRSFELRSLSQDLSSASSTLSFSANSINVNSFSFKRRSTVEGPSPAEDLQDSNRNQAK